MSVRFTIACGYTINAVAIPESVIESSIPTPPIVENITIPDKMLTAASESAIITQSFATFADSPR